MKKINLLLISFLGVLTFIGCSKDNDDIIDNPGGEIEPPVVVIDNTAPEFTTQIFEVDENVENDYSVGVLVATDKENNELSFELLDADVPFTVNEISGEITVSNYIDFETEESYEFLVAVNDGELSTQTTVIISVNDIPESSYSAAEQTRLIELFKYMSLFKSSYLAQSTKKWESEVNIYLSGDYNSEDILVIDDFITELNGLNVYNLQLNRVDNLVASNLEIWVATIDEFVNNRPDYANGYGYEVIAPSTGGYAIPWVDSATNGIVLANIWLNKENYNISAIKHEILHTLGFGHSEDIVSVLYYLSSNGDKKLSDDDIFVIEAMYSEYMDSNYNEVQIEAALLEYFLTI